MGKSTGDSRTLLLTESKNGKDFTDGVFPRKGSGCLSLFVRCCQKRECKIPRQWPYLLWETWDIDTNVNTHLSQQYVSLTVKNEKEAAFIATEVPVEFGQTHFHVA